MENKLEAFMKMNTAVTKLKNRFIETNKYDTDVETLFDLIDSLSIRLKDAATIHAGIMDIDETEISQTNDLLDELSEPLDVSIAYGWDLLNILNYD